jgi:hypothetical protein
MKRILKKVEKRSDMKNLDTLQEKKEEEQNRKVGIRQNAGIRKEQQAAKKEKNGKLRESFPALKAKIKRFKEMNDSDDDYRKNLNDGEEARDEIIYWFNENAEDLHLKKFLSIIEQTQKTFPGCSEQFIEDVISGVIDDWYYEQI